MKYILILIISFPLLTNELYLNVEQKFMDANWNFLPEVPPSFKENNSESIEAGFSYKKLQGKLFINEIVFPIVMLNIVSSPGSMMCSQSASPSSRNTSTCSVKICV